MRFYNYFAGVSQCAGAKFRRNNKTIDCTTKNGHFFVLFENLKMPKHRASTTGFSEFALQRLTAT